MATYEAVTSEEETLLAQALADGEPLPAGYAYNPGWSPRFRKVVDGGGETVYGPVDTLLDARIDAIETDQQTLLQEPRHLRRWFSDLAEAGGAQKVITVVGDSITVGAYAGGTGFGDWRKSGWVAHLRRQVQVIYGDVGPGHAKWEEDDRITVSGGSTSGTTGPMQKGRQIGAGNTLTMVPDAACTGFHITYWDQGGSFTYAIDGGSTTTVTPGGTDAMAARSISGLSDAVHTIVITGVGTAHIGTVRPTRGTSSGVVVNRFGRSGATTEVAAMSASTSANRNRMLDATFKVTGTDLAIIMLGANDIPNQLTNSITPAVFRSNLKILTDYVTAQGGCSLLIAGPRYDSEVSGGSTQAEYYAEMADLAGTDDHVAHLDLMDVWGSYATVTQADLDFYYDTIHPTSAGHQSLGQFVADAVLRSQPVV